ncbi:hypothetical protein CcaverHIS002_0605530 [Cutaneotrichosporon cavernicola]|nr:hypothetical protein CcaverHIS002_0605530 [Cutaneotrichosporon cavernicola]
MNDGGDPHRVLARNAACHQCRRRKLKCDAVRPTCGNCRKPRQRGPEKYEPPEACSWDEARDPSARTLRKREAKAARRINTGKPPPAAPAMWGNGVAGPATLSMHQHPVMHGQPGLPLPESHAPLDPSYPKSYNGDSVPPSMLSSMRPQTMSTSPNDPPPPLPLPPQHGFPNNIHWAEPQRSEPHMTGASAYHQQQYSGPISDNSFHGHNSTGPPLNPQVSQVMFSDWPHDLPHPETVHHMVDVFFARVRLIPNMFHRASFLANLTLPPSHRDFPTLAVMHGILALTAPYIPPESLASRAYFPVGSPRDAAVHPEYDFSPRSSLHPASSLMTLTPTSIGDGSALHRFQMWHRCKSYENLSQLVTNGLYLIQAVQSALCTTWVDLKNGWWSDVWVESGNAVRMSVPLHLNLSSKSEADPLSHNIGSILREAGTELEQAQRDRVWWCVYLTERAAACGSLWPNAIADDDITVELPITRHIFDSGVGDLVGVQTFQSPNFYSHHPSQHRDTLCMYIKVTRVMSDVLTFMRKYSRGLHTFQRFFSDPNFQQVFNNIGTLRSSMPEEFRTSTTNTPHGPVVDPDKYIVIDLLHCALITIGGPLITHQTWMLPQARHILHEIRHVVSNYLELAATSFDITQLSVHVSFIWFSAARNLIRFIHCAMKSDLVQAQMELPAFDADLRQLMGALARMGERFPTALRYAKVLEATRARPIEPVGEIIVLNRDENIFDSEYGGNLPRKTPSSSSTVSPTVFQDVTPVNPGSSKTGSPPNPPGVSPLLGTGRPQQPQQPEAQMGAQNVYYSDDAKDFSQWFKPEAFDVSTYSFDVEAMTQLVNAHGPNGPNMQFDGSMLAFPN